MRSSYHGGLGKQGGAWAAIVVLGLAFPAVLFWSGSVRAETGFDVKGEYRFRLNNLGDFPVDDAGRELGRAGWQEGRLRISPEAAIGDNLGIYAQFDLISGRYGGDSADLGVDYVDWPWDGHDDYEDFYFRQLWVEYTSKVGVLRVGQMSSQWGLGLVSNNGEDELNEFGDSYGGDIYRRLLFATKPLLIFNQSDFAERWVVAVGYDWVWRDDNADYDAGDRAEEAVFSTFYDDPGRLFAGLYMAFRDQDDDDGDYVKAAAYDVFVKYQSGPTNLGPVFSAAFEGVIIRGETDRVILETSPKHLDLDGYGAVLRLGAGFPDTGFRVGVELGYATGDANPYDDTNYALKFDPNFNVGIVLFQEVMSSLTSVQPEPLGDPNRVNFPQKGIDQLPSNGAVSNVFYQSFLVAWEPAAADDRGWIMKGMVLHAAAVEDFMDPYQTFKAGGNPTNFHGRVSDSLELGWELDGELGCMYTIGDRVVLRAGAQYGYFIPGEAFRDRNGDAGDPVEKLQGRASVSW